MPAARIEPNALRLGKAFMMQWNYLVFMARRYEGDGDDEEAEENSRTVYKPGQLSRRSRSLCKAYYMP